MTTVNCGRRASISRAAEIPPPGRSTPSRAICGWVLKTASTASAAFVAYAHTMKRTSRLRRVRISLSMPSTLSAISTRRGGSSCGSSPLREAVTGGTRSSLALLLLNCQQTYPQLQSCCDVSIAGIPCAETCTLSFACTRRQTGCEVLRLDSDCQRPGSQGRRESTICGIIAYAGRRLARPLLLAGLERLEYRGYDSAGLCFVVGDGAQARLERVRAAGSVGELTRSLNGTGAGAHCGIGHTRWATHGRVSIENAHPFLSCDESVAVALNGIVENFGELRLELARHGHRFESETDAEVVCHLVADHYQGDLTAAVSAAAARLEGHFAFICCHRDQRQLLVGFRRE